WTESKQTSAILMGVCRLLFKHQKNTSLAARCDVE
ncbi:hypothetical protein PF011_g29699, partial [Phytophthora fragariae]